MKVKTVSSPFGSPTRTRVLLVLHALGESYARELERILEAPVSVVQKALRSLEADGIVAGRSVGRTRLYRIDPRYFAAREIRILLKRLAEPESDLRDRIARIRRRPRIGGKPLWP
jgi:DNA-binding transcriptional ArsR family regulator